IVILPVGDRQAIGISGAQIWERFGRIAQVFGREIEQHRLPPPPFEPEAQAQPIIRHREVLSAFFAHVDLHRLPPETAAAIRGNQAKSRIARTESDSIAAGKQVQDGIIWTLDLSCRTLARTVPDTNRAALAPIVRSAGIEPLAVCRPGDTQEKAIYALGICRKAPIQ